MSSQNIYFLTDKNGRKTHAVLPIETYEALIGLSDMVKNTATISHHEIYTFKVKNVIAQGYPKGPKTHSAFVLIKDSQLVLNTVESLPKHIKDIREKLLGEGALELDAIHECFVLKRDLPLKSSSVAAALVSGNVRNGLDVWLNREGFSLKRSGYGPKGTTDLKSKKKG